ncbi:phosphoethanolamine--lipid A transferase [Halomonas sp. YLGW01]|uniref:phosphoethanolamine--lipid A transferase n=1 Tax=Halomonas sp. YLGW01 TaxID=2773308 RepID=UPI001F5B2E34|nr:phosphoethanolamine--lipid A transferase [Halomonas sp. YLGW01]
MPPSSSPPHRQVSPAKARPTPAEPGPDTALGREGKRPSSRWLTRLLIGWATFLAVMLFGRSAGLDFRLADAFYHLQGDTWSLHHAFLTEQVLHEGGRLLSQSMGVTAILALIASWLFPALRTWRRPLGYLVLAVATSTLGVSLLKQLISMDCPWDLSRYGGARAHVGLLATRPADYPDTACFPAGHASAGYAWIALYYFFNATRPRWRWAGLGLAIAMGLAFGIAQQLRGAHFLSHDLWTLMLCTTLSLSLAHWLLPSSVSLAAPKRPLPRSRKPRMLERLRLAASWLAGQSRPSLTLSPERLTALVCLVFTLFYQQAFWQQVMAAEPALTAWQLLAYGLVLTGLQFIVFVLFVTRHTAKPLLAALILLAAMVSYFTGHYGTYVDTHMIDNVLQTDTKEAGELLTPGFASYLLLYAGLPLALLWRVRLATSTWPRALGRRLAYLAGGLVVLAVSLAVSYQSLSSLMRNHTELRYLVTPGNALISTGRVLAASDPLPAQRLPIGEDATRLPRAGDKPLLMVLVVGETVRAANWGLNGYARQTTPQLAKRDVINFTDVSTCGTSTAVSLPCMFAPIGKADYDERYIKSHESLLDVLKHAGVNVLWLDNQAGCKGVCDGVSHKAIRPDHHPQQCADGRCLDEALDEELRDRLDGLDGDTVIVLHQLGNHGPSYYQRYPEAFRRFTPTCDSADLNGCSQQAIINSYDNAILYTDSVLDHLIGALAEQSHHAASLLYLSDHGESLGEHGLYLHGLPYAIAPQEQTQVPMVWWSSSAFDDAVGLDKGCLSTTRDAPIRHANLFYTVLGAMEVDSRIMKSQLDMTHACRGHR